MIKMLNQNMTPRGTQATGLGVMIGRCSPDIQHGRPSGHPANVGCLFFRYTNDELRNHINQRRKHKKWTGEDNRLALPCYFKSKPTQRGYRKKWYTSGKNVIVFSQRLADQVRTIIKKGWFSDLEINQKIKNEQDSNRAPDTSRFNNEK